MELAIEDSSNIFGTCAGDFLCTYMDTISWRTPTQPLPMELNPRVVFERMFGGDGASAEARRARLDQSTSILDAVVADVSGLAKGLTQRSRTARRIPRERSGGRAAHHAGRDAARAAPPRSARNTERHPRVVRRARKTHVRAAGARVPGRPHPGDVVHDGPRAQRLELPADRHQRRPPPDLAQQLRRQADGARRRRWTRTT